MDDVGVVAGHRVETFTTVRQARQRLLTVAGLAEALRADEAAEVVVILASSRGGSSALFSALRATGAFMCLPGEHTHLYKLHGYGLPESPFAHDGQVGPDADPAGLLAAIGDECALEAAAAERGEAAASWLATRLVTQWPHLSARIEEVTEVVGESLHDELAATSPEALLLTILRRLRARGESVNPWYYDLPAEVIADWFPDLPPPSGPPTVGHLVEEPPFLVPALPRPGSTPARPRPLLLKASVDAYRVEQLSRLFPASRLRFVHLTRNPAAAINGLMEGWLSRGFFSHRLDDAFPYGIEGYSHLPWGGTWWNFDLPPGYETAAGQPLPHLCALQWRQAHEHILLAGAAELGPWLRVRAEELLAGADRRDALLGEVLAFALGRSADLPEVRPPSVVMATTAPRPRRWQASAARLADALADDGVRGMATALGYGPEPAEDWL